MSVDDAQSCIEPLETNWDPARCCNLGGFAQQPTFLNLDQPYPRQVFTVVIFDDERSKFDQPEVTFKGKPVCATGRIEMYRGKPEMISNDPARLRPDDGRTAAPPTTLTPAATE